MKRGTPDHPKTLGLMRRLSCSRFEAIGILETLWHWTARFAPRGDIGRWTDVQIEAGLGWSGPEGLIPALLESRWLDSDQTHRLIVHDWAQHADDATKKVLHRANLEFVSPSSAVVAPPADIHREDGGQRPPAVAVAVPCLAVALPEPHDGPPSAPPSATVLDADARKVFARAVWEAWCQKRGSGASGSLRQMSHVEWDLLRRWIEKGTPLRVILRGIADCSSGKITPRTPLSYAGPAVEEAAQHWAQGQTL